MSFKTKESRLLLILAAFFIANAILAEFIGVKIFSVEGSLGISRFDINMFGVPDLSFNMSAGVVTWPLIFIMTDIINEYFGVNMDLAFNSIFGQGMWIIGGSIIAFLIGQMADVLIFTWYTGSLINSLERICQRN